MSNMILDLVAFKAKREREGNPEEGSGSPEGLIVSWAPSKPTRSAEPPITFEMSDMRVRRQRAIQKEINARIVKGLKNKSE